MSVIGLEMRKRVFERKLAGESETEIGRSLKISRQRVSHIYREVLAQYESPLVDEVRTHEDAVLLAVRKAHWAGAMSGDEKASAIVLRTVDARLKLHGANAPTEINVSVIDAVDAEIARLSETIGRTPPGSIDRQAGRVGGSSNGDRQPA